MDKGQAFGVDIGFFESKGVNSRGWEPRISSLVGSADMVLFNGLNGYQDIVLETPFPCRVGGDVVNQSIWESRRQDRNWWQGREWNALLLAMLTELHGVSCEATLVLGWPASWYLADMQAIRAALLGEHVVKREGRPQQRFNLVDVRVLPQGLGLPMDVVFNDDGQVVNEIVFNARVGVINVGSNNSNLLDVTRLRVGAASASPGLGSWKAVESLQRVLAVKAPSLKLSDHEVDGVLRSGGVNVGSKWLDLRVEIAEIKDNFASSVLAEVSQLWGSGDQFKAILVGGGASHHIWDQISAAYPHAELHPRPVNGDAHGFHKFARRVAK